MLAWRTRFGKEELERRPERYGLASINRPSGFVAWFHAASVGETNAVLPVIEAIGKEHPNMSVLLTTGTVTSAQLAGARLPARAMHQYLPLDNPSYIQRFLDHWRPDLAVLVESEIWPNLLLETKARNVPLVLVNGRISPRSFKRWRRRPGLSRPLFSCFDLALAQNEMLAQRFAQLGAAEAHGVGNLKADAPPPPVDKDAQNSIGAAIAGRAVWLAASTHQGEDEMVASAHMAMKRIKPNLLTIIVPRHPDRGPLILKQLSALGLNVVLRSAGRLPDAATDIYVADTIGEMGLFYTLAPVAFVGGSLVRRGGQNPVEPIKLGAAVLTGPNFQNFRDSYEELLKAGGAKQVDDAASLGAVALALLNDNQARSDMMARAERALAGMSGALPKTLAALERYLPPKASIEHA
jgi:3-deoxy-D-manno-octulosonic-acid transferase